MLDQSATQSGGMHRRSNAAAALATGSRAAGFARTPGSAAPEVKSSTLGPATRDGVDDGLRSAPLPAAVPAMAWWEAWAFNALHAVVAATGVVYFWMKYGMTPTDPFAVVNHPWQSATLALHIVAAPFFVVFFGMLFRSHTLRKILSANPRNRRSGWMSLVSFSGMALTGYLAQVASSPAWVTAFVWAHVVVGAIFVIGYTTHVVIGWRLGRVSTLAAEARRRAAVSVS